MDREQEEEAQLILILFRDFRELNTRAQVIIAVIVLLLGGWYYWHKMHGSFSVPASTTTTASPGSAGTPTPVTGPCADKVPYGAPSPIGAPDTQLGSIRLICRTGYLVGYSGVTKTPLWVAEHLQSDAIFGKEPRTNNFTEDTSLPADERAALADYSRSGYDRGHMAPAADFSRSAQEMSESFFLSNMVPQFPENNRSPWAHLEGHVRSITKDTKDIYVVTGPVFSLSERKTIGPHQVSVPSQLFKLVLDPSRGKVGAWLLPNAAVPGDGWNAYCTSAKKIEEATGLTFFPSVSADQRNQLISQSCAL